MAMSDGIAVQLRYPFTGRWLVQNSPANRVPSHGTTLFASSYAIDFVPVDERGHSAPMTARTLFGRESADSFSASEHRCWPRARGTSCSWKIRCPTTTPIEALPRSATR